MSFIGVVDRRGIRCLSHTLHMAAKIGSDITIETTRDALLLRTLAASHAAYVLIKLRQNFFLPDSFHNYDDTGSLLAPSPLPATGSSQAAAAPAPTQSGRYLKARVQLKHFLLAFRHIAHPAASAAELEIRLVSRENKMWLRYTVLGVTTTVGVPFDSQDNILQADFPRDNSANLIIFKPTLFLKALEHFPPKTAEITLLVDPVQAIVDPNTGRTEYEPITQLRLKNFEQNSLLNSNTNQQGVQQLASGMDTESNIPAEQLERTEIPSAAEGVDLTFNVREVRAYLQYVESLNDQDVVCRWSQTGQPMLYESIMHHVQQPPPSMVEGVSQSQTQPGYLSAAEQGPLHSELVIATLQETVAPSQQQQQQQIPRPVGPVAAPGADAASQQYQIKQSAPNASATNATPAHRGISLHHEVNIPATP